MLRISILVCAYVCATFTLGQQLNYRKPWPRYSLQNMPQTQFTCHDKILGGYYADAETQCQMFHVCVKVAGVGVQDFRFLCPNGTAFDQEAQICADWGDVDCELSVLYYGSDNFDLYRIGSGFESKRAPLAEEEEATFHLQRAESADVRRSKETRIDQKLRPDQPPNYTKYFESTPRSFLNNYASAKQHSQKQQQQHQEQYHQKKLEVVKKPSIVNYYTPTSTTSTTTTTTEIYNNDVSKQDFDEIFKGSHSSNFFSNRNGGREDDLEFGPKTQYNDFNDYNKKIETSTNGKTRVPQPTRAKRIQKTTTTSTTAAPTTFTTTARAVKTTKPTTTSTSTSATPKVTKKIALQASYNTDFITYAQNYRSSTTIKTTTTPIPTITTARAVFNYNNNNNNYNGNSNRFNLGSSNYQTQAKIQPTTYNPAYGVYNLKITTPKYADLSHDKISHESNQAAALLVAQSDVPRLDKPKSYNNKPTAALSQRKSQKIERTKSTKLAAQNATYVKPNELSDFSKVKVAQPKPFQPSQVFRAPVSSPNLEPQYYRTRGQQQVQHVKFGNDEPAPFSVPQKETKVKSSTSSPRGVSNRGSINYKASTQRQAELFGPTTYSSKKFSTLVPKDQYSPTTFKPTTHYNNPSHELYYQTQQTARPVVKNKKLPSTTTTTAVPTTINPYYNPDEDDGQYHPELYETDFPRNRLNVQRSSTTTTTAPITTTTTTTRKSFNYNNFNFQNPQTHLKTQQQTSIQKQQEHSSQSADLSDEDELFKTAHSLNFGAASINKLRADIIKAEKTSQQYNSQYSPNLQVTSPKPATATATAVTGAAYSTTSKHSFSTTSKPQFTTYLTTVTPTTSTTVRTTTSTSTTAKPQVYDAPKSNNKTSGKTSKNSGKGKKYTSSKNAAKPASNRPPHADEDTSYDYAYYDTDTLSESPQEYPEYEISEFIKTRKN